MDDLEQSTSVLVNDHSELDALADDLVTALDEKDRLKAFELLDLLWARLAVHIRAEHLCLFPSILGANFTVRSDGHDYKEVKSAIDQLRSDHDFFMHELGTTVNTMRKHDDASEEVISKELLEVRLSVIKVQSRLERHNYLEENHVYKWTNLVLGADERLALAARIKHELNNIPPRFKV